MAKTDHRRSGIVPIALAAVLLGMASTAVAGAAPIAFHIPAQSAPRALNEFAAQAHVQLLFDYKALNGFKTKSLDGRMQAATALALLLKGSGFVFQRVNDRTFAIAPSSSARKDGPGKDRERRASADDPAAPADKTAPARAGQSVALAEIVVTAERTRERLVDAPVAVTALSGRALSDAGIQGTQGLSELAPSLSFRGGNHMSNNNFQIRGIGTQVFSHALESDVAVIVDGVSMATAAQGFTDLADVERVEVIRGPQSTLFGKDAVGGVIHVITEPVSKRLQGKADMTIAQGQEYRFRGTISGPLTEELGFRLTSYYDDVGGNVYNVPHHRMINGYDSLGFRGKLRWAPTNALDFILTGDYRNMHGYCCMQTFVKVVNPLLSQLLADASITAGVNNRGDDENTLISNSTAQTLVSLRGNLHLSGGTLSSTTAYQFFHSRFNQPVDGLNTPTPLYLPFGLGSLDVNGGPWSTSQFTEDLRFTSPSGRRLSYVGGLYYLHHSVNTAYQQRFGLSVCKPGTAPASYGAPCGAGLFLSSAGFHSNSQETNVAAYGQANLKLVGKLSFLGGARIQHDHVTFWANRPNQRVVPGDIPLHPAAFGSGATSDTAATGKAGLKYQFGRNSQGYVTWSTGYKGPGYDVAIGAPIVNERPVRPETARDWELGYKTLTFNGRLRVNADIFYEKYTNLQVQATNVGSGGVVQFMPVNAGSAESKGVELDFQARPMASLTLRGGVTYLDTKVNVDGLQCPLDERAGSPVMTSGALYNQCFRTSAAATPILNVRGGVLPNASKWRGNLLARYDHVISHTGLAGFVQVSATSQTGINFSLNQDPQTVQRAYTITNASIGVFSLDGIYHVSLFADNLFNQHYLSLMFGSPLLTSATVTPGNEMGIVPKDANRYFGITMGVSF